MAKLYLLNAFSLNMIRDRGWIHLNIRELSPAAAKEIVEEKRRKGFEVISAIGHPATASLASKILGFEVPASRAAVTFEDGDQAVVFMVSIRLPEGKILSEDELWSLYMEGKLKILHLVYSISYW
ncbi:MAG: STIV orfB116 family protein [Candidatus Nezhaarchaeales archaeon]